MRNSSKETAPGKSERYREIVAILAKHGIGVLGRQIGKDEQEQESLRAVHLREACEELGTTFIKLGQALATRGDLLSQTYRDELRKLQDDVPPVGDEAIESVIVEEFGASPELLFASFDRTPVASASIGQVHAAVLIDGREVMVKVRKPGVEHLVEADLAILCDLAQSWSDRFPVLEQYDVERLVREFGDTLRAELDYRREAANLQAFREIFAGQRGFDLPECVAEWSGERVLTLTRVSGVSADNVEAIDPRLRVSVARRIARFVLEPAFEHGLLHADPHAGNLFVTADGALAVVDFGMVARLSPQSRRHVADMLHAIDRRDAQRLADRLVDAAPPAQPVDRAVLISDVERILNRYDQNATAGGAFSEALTAILELIREHRLRLPGSLAQLFKALVMSEGLLETLAPETGLNDYLEPMAAKLLYSRVAGGDFLELPRRAERVLGEVERGNLRVWARLDDVDTLVARFERVVERANATMLAAACIVAIAIVMLVYHPQGWERWIGIVFWVAVAATFVHILRTLLALRK